MTRTRFFILAAALMCCLSCVETNSQLGMNLIPKDQLYKFYTEEFLLEEIDMELADKLSGYSNKRITVGAIKDSEYGISASASVLTLIPIYRDSLDMGTNPIFKSFHFSAAKDTTSFVEPSQERIFQTFHVYELEKALDQDINYDCNLPVAHKSESINQNSVIYNGGDSLSFNFSQAFGEKYLSMTNEDLSDIDTYLAKFPGIYIESEEPVENGGRINIFKLQVDYNSDYTYFAGNFAKLRFSSEYGGVRKDTSLMFYYGANKLYNIDSLLTNVSIGAFPQYSLNLSSQQTASLAGRASDKVLIQGGGGLKPVVRASEIKTFVEEAILSKGGDPKTAVVNKATIVFPFEFPEDYTDMNHWPQRLSPTCKIMDDENGYSTFMGLSDSSSSNENQGDIDRSNLNYSPDISYHVQSLLRIDEDDVNNSKTKRLLNGSLDIWFLIMANEVTTTTSSGSSEMSEFYNYLAYQSYYNDMYGGYGGYGYGGYGYGYGGYGYNNYYNNYYNYAMLAAAASQSQTQQSYSVELDKDRYYKAALNGPQNPGRKPKLIVTYGIPSEY